MSATLNAVLTRGADCPPALALDALVGGETPAGAAEHLVHCVHCAGYVAALRAEAESFLKARPGDRFTRQVARRETKRAELPHRAGWVLAGLATLAILGVVAPRVLSIPAAPITFKGSLIGVHLQRGTEVRAVQPGERLHGNDALRFTVRSEKPGYAAVWEKDVSGQVTVVAPFAAPRPQTVSAGVTTLDDSAVLDTVGHEEIFVAIFSEKPFDLQRVTESLRSAHAAEAITCDGCQVQWLRFDKTP